MKTKNILGIFGAALAVSFGVLSPIKSVQKANAVDTIDVGTIEIEEARNAISSATDIYLVPAADTGLPDSWDYAYHPVGEEDGVYLNGEKINIVEGIKHAGTGSKRVTFWIRLNKAASENDVVTFKGTWLSTTDNTKSYQFTFESYSIKRVNSKWDYNYELEPYDTITLSDACFEDKDKVSFDTAGYVPSAWNTYAISPDNTRNSFAIKFLFESFGNPKSMAATLTIRVGTSGAWNTGHFYSIDINNTWGPSGVISFRESNGDTLIYKAPDAECNLNPGSRHTIEFGSIYLKDSEKTFNFVKYDGELLYQEVRKPYNHERTTKLSCSYGGNDIFIGSVPTEEKENTQILQYSYLSSTKEGIYLNGSLNDIPVGDNWTTRGVPVNKNNALINGEPIYTPFGGSPLVKISLEEENSYYLDLKAGGVTLKEGDVITLSDEYRVYLDGKTYSLGIIPVSFLYQNKQMSQISDINTYLYNEISNHCDPEYYDEDKILEIEQIVSEAETPIKSETNMKSLWDLYHSYIEALDAIPFNEEKAKEILDRAKEAAKAELNALADSDKYLAEELEVVQGYVDDAISEIEKETTDTVKKVEQIVIETTELISKIKTKQEYVEEILLEKGLSEETIQYLEDFERVTTSDLCATGDLLFHQKGGSEYTYHSGGYDDTSTRIATSKDNPNGNMVFQFIYESDAPSARSLIREGEEERFGAQIFIRMRGVSDTDAYRFDIATITGDETNAGVALGSFLNDVAVGRVTFNAQLKADTQYKIECGAIDLDGYERTLLFMKIDDELVLSSVVDSLKESAPCIRITDSYADDTHYAKMSPIEEGTTKSDYSSLVGRLILDEQSSTEGKLVTSLRDNEIPVGAQLYPMSKEAITINGEETLMKDVHPTTYVEKTGTNRYVVVLGGHELNDEDVVSIGGYFAYFDTETMNKSIYRLFDTSFTYHASSQSWEQAVPTDRDVIVYEAKETIRNYANLDNYSEEAQLEINEIVNRYVALIDETETEAIASLVEEAIGEIDKVNTLLDDYKEYAKELLASYTSPDLYRDEEKAELESILSDAYTRIDACTDEASIDLILGQTTLQIDQLKTAEERDAEDLANAKKVAKNAVEAYASLLELNRYSEENAALLTTLTYNALDDIDAATSIEQVNSIVEAYKEAVKEVKTKDGSTFDGEKYIEKKKKGGCGGSIIAGSSVTLIALISALALLLVKKFKEN